MFGCPAPAQPFPRSRAAAPASGAHAPLMKPLQDGHLDVPSQGREHGIEHSLDECAMSGRIKRLVEGAHTVGPVVRRADLQEAGLRHDAAEAGAAGNGRRASFEHSENECASGVSHPDTVSHAAGSASLIPVEKLSVEAA